MNNGDGQHFLITKQMYKSGEYDDWIKMLTSIVKFDENGIFINYEHNKKVDIYFLTDEMNKIIDELIKKDSVHIKSEELGLIVNTTFIDKYGDSPDKTITDSFMLDNIYSRIKHFEEKTKPQKITKDNINKLTDVFKKPKNPYNK